MNLSLDDAIEHCQNVIESGGDCSRSITKLRRKDIGIGDKFCSTMCPIHEGDCACSNVVVKAKLFLRNNLQDKDNVI